MIYKSIISDNLLFPEMLYDLQTNKESTCNSNRLSQCAPSCIRQPIYIPVKSCKDLRICIYIYIEYRSWFIQVFNIRSSTTCNRSQHFFLRFSRQLPVFSSQLLLQVLDIHIETARSHHLDRIQLPLSCDCRKHTLKKVISLVISCHAVFIWISTWDFVWFCPSWPSSPFCQHYQP